jgi:hypothetical protein
LKKRIIVASTFMALALGAMRRQGSRTEILPPIRIKAMKSTQDTFTFVVYRFMNREVHVVADVIRALTKPCLG